LLGLLQLTGVGFGVLLLEVLSHDEIKIAMAKNGVIFIFSMLYYNTSLEQAFIKS
jgi:hypothetical protein